MSTGAERYAAKSNVKLGGFRSQLEASYVSSDIEELWYYMHETLVPIEVISSGCNALVVPFQQLLQGPMEVLLCEPVNNLRHSLFHHFNCLITTASEFREQRNYFEGD